MNQRITEVHEVVDVEGVRFHQTALTGVVLVEPRVHGDERGFFVETHHQRKYVAGGIDATFVQDNHSKSRQRTLRGLHTQVENPQGKLLRAVEGEIFDVAVDVRGGSPTWGKWYGTELSAENFRQLYVPPGFLHGFLVLSEVAQVEYKCTALYHPDDEISVAWNDAELAIDWPDGEPLLSARDQAASRVSDIRETLSGITPFSGD